MGEDEELGRVAELRELLVLHQDVVAINEQVKTGSNRRVVLFTLLVIMVVTNFATLALFFLRAFGYSKLPDDLLKWLAISVLGESLALLRVCTRDLFPGRDTPRGKSKAKRSAAKSGV